MKNILYKLKNKIFCTAFAILLVVNLCVIMPAEEALAASYPPTPDWDKSGGGTISVTLKDEDKNEIKTGALTIYLVADLKEENKKFSYTYTSAFAGAGSIIDASELLNEANDNPVDLAERLARYVAQNGITGTEGQNTSGTVTFENLEFGLYLVVQTTVSEGYEEATPFIVCLPMYEENAWVYDVDASPKIGVLTAKTSSTGTSSVSSGSGSSSGTGGTKTSETTGTAAKLPQTGQLFWPIPILGACGALLFIVGGIIVLIDKKRNTPQRIKL